MLLFRAALLVLWLGPLPALAQEGPMMEGTLPDSIVVTASRYAEDIRLTGRRVTVWTARDLAALPVSSVDELLRAVGGVEVQSRGGFGVQSDLTVRGSTFNGVLVLIDGARLNDPMTGHFLADLPIPLSEIARVEVLRGPAAALYGPDAVGGVIQIFTYAGLREAGMGPSRLEGQGHVQRGAYGLYDLGGAARRAGRHTALSAATVWQGSAGMPVLGEGGELIRSSEGEVRTDFQRRAHTAALVYDLGGAALFARAGVDARDFGAFHFYTPFPSDTAREATSTGWLQLRLSRAPAPTQWQVQVSAKHHEDVYTYNPQTPANRHTSRLLVGQAQASHRVGERLVVVGGTSLAGRGIDSNNLGRHQDFSAGLFGLALWRLQHNLAVRAGGRLDYDPAYRLEITPQFSAAYDRGVLVMRAALGRAVRAPNYVERYFNTTLARPRGRSLGNPELRPEHAWTYEGGVDLYPAAGLSLHATAFRRETRDLIDYAMLTPADTVFLARNLLRVRTQGLEVDAEMHRSWGARRMHGAVTYTWLDPHLGVVEEGVQYKYALTHARHLLQGQVALGLRGVTLGLQGLWKKRLTDTSYALFNVRLGYRLGIGRQHLVLSGEVRNLFDVEYSEVFDAPMPGRWWLAGLRLVR